MYLTAEIDLHPSHFGTKLKATVRQRLMKEKEGTSVDQYGYVVYVVAIDDEDIGAGVVDSTTGYAKFVVRYLALLFRPFKNEVCDAVVQSVSTVCVHVGSRRLLQALGFVAWPSVTLFVLATVGLLRTARAIQCVLHTQRKWRVQWRSSHVVRVTTGQHTPTHNNDVEPGIDIECCSLTWQRFPEDLVLKEGKRWESEDGAMTIEEGTVVRIKIISATLGSTQLVRSLVAPHCCGCSVLCACCVVPGFLSPCTSWVACYVRVWLTVCCSLHRRGLPGCCVANNTSFVRVRDCAFLMSG